MGEDAKVDYNAIEKYLKCKDLIAYSFTEKEIGKMMGESENQNQRVSLNNELDGRLPRTAGLSRYLYKAR
jgi:hypothetical protein